MDARGLPLFLQERAHAFLIPLAEDQQFEFGGVGDVVFVLRPDVDLEPGAAHVTPEPFSFQVGDVLGADVLLPHQEDAVQVGLVGEVDLAVGLLEVEEAGLEVFQGFGHDAGRVLQGSGVAFDFAQGSTTLGAPRKGVEKDGGGHARAQAQPAVRVAQFLVHLARARGGIGDVRGDDAVELGADVLE